MISEDPYRFYRTVLSQNKRKPYQRGKFEVWIHVLVFPDYYRKAEELTYATYRVKNEAGEGK